MLLPNTAKNISLSTDKLYPTISSQYFLFSAPNEPETSVLLQPQVIAADGTHLPTWQPMRVIIDGNLLPVVPVQERTLMDAWCLDIIDAVAERAKHDSTFDATEIMLAAFAINYAKK